MIQEIELSKLKNHPMNVRRTYTDIDELADSIKNNGVMQNLTVIPDPDQEGCYLVVIGNRRLLAAQKAGLQTVPCQITDMDQKTVAETMLLENMQRNDLSIIDQAYGFQLCLDLGDTAADIAEKTGLSKQTVKHRIEIARLDEDSLERRFNDPNFQLTMTDLIALEKIKNVDKRNEILNSAYSSAEMRRLTENAVRDQNRQEAADKILQELKPIKTLKIKPAPKSFEGQLYTGKLEEVASFDLDGKVNPEFNENCRKKVLKYAFSDTQLYYMIYWQNLKIVKESDRKKKKQEIQLTPREKAAIEIQQHCKQMSKDRRAFVNEIIKQGRKCYAKDNLATLIESIFRTDANCSIVAEMRAEVGSDYWKMTNEERQELRKKIEARPIEHRCLAAIMEAVSGDDTVDYRKVYDEEAADRLFAAYEALANYNYVLTQEETQILSGTHPLYKELADEKGN